MTVYIPRGEKGPLLHTVKSRQRVMAGLSWDARETKVGLFGRFIKSDSQHDLDISCYVFNSSGEFIDFVGAEAQDSMDQSGKIYHSGDDMSGSGQGDDETISAELASLPKEIHALVFLVEVRSAHHFEDVLTPTVRLSDGMTNDNLLEVILDKDESTGKNAFVFCSIFKSRSSPTGWMLYNVCEYPDISNIEDWGVYLSQFSD